MKYYLICEKPDNIIINYHRFVFDNNVNVYVRYHNDDILLCENPKIMDYYMLCHPYRHDYIENNEIVHYTKHPNHCFSGGRNTKDKNGFLKILYNAQTFEILSDNFGPDICLLDSHLLLIFKCIFSENNDIPYYSFEVIDYQSIIDILGYEKTINFFKNIDGAIFDDFNKLMHNYVNTITKNKQLNIENEELKTKIHYTPGNDGYFEALTSFNNALDNKNNNM